MDVREDARRWQHRLVCGADGNSGFDIQASDSLASKTGNPAKVPGSPFSSRSNMNGTKLHEFSVALHNAKEAAIG